jgi:hypothetical protein
VTAARMARGCWGLVAGCSHDSGAGADSAPWWRCSHHGHPAWRASSSDPRMADNRRGSLTLGGVVAGWASTVQLR